MGRVRPPRTCRLAVGLICRRHDCVEQTRVVPYAVPFADRFVDVEGIAAGKVVDLRDPGTAQIAGYRRTNVHQAGQIARLLGWHGLTMPWHHTLSLERIRHPPI